MTKLQGGCRLHKGRIVGWARDPDVEGSIDIVATTNTGVLMYQGPANIFRSDLKEKCIGDGKFGFNFSIPSSIFDQNIVVHIRQSGSESPIPGSPIILNEEFWRYRTILSTKIGLPFFGVFSDKISEDSVQVIGYALPPENAKNGDYKLYVNGIRVDSVPASREDTIRIDEYKKILWFVHGYENSAFCLNLNTKKYSIFDDVDGSHLIKIGFGHNVEEAMDPLRVVYIPINYNAEIRLAGYNKRARVMGPDASITKFVTLGYSHYRYYRQIYEYYTGKQWARIQKIVDWGCGCGRVTQFLIRSLPENRVIGVDIDQDNILWCQENIPNGAFHVGPLYPPMQLEDCSVDYLVATSVFTHLVGETQILWLKEIHRVLKPGAIAALTVATDCRVAWGSFDSTWIEDLEKKGINDTVVSNDLAGYVDEKAYYRNVRMTKNYIRQNWKQWFEVVDICDHVFAFQDVVICRKRMESIKIEGGCRIHKGKIIGWAKVSGSEAPVSLEILTGSNDLIWRGEANIYREDLKAKGIGEGRHGFACQIPAQLLGSVHYLHIREVYSGMELPNSPLELGESFFKHRNRLLAMLSPPVWGIVSHVVNGFDITIVGYLVAPEGEIDNYGIYVDKHQIADMSKQNRNIPTLDSLKETFWFSSNNEQLGFEIVLNINQHIKPNPLDLTPSISIGFGKDAKDVEDPLKLIHIPFLGKQLVLPNDERRKRVQRNTSDVHFITLGYTHYHYYRHLFELYGGRPWNDIEKMLDWGCGCGRVSQFFIRSLKAGKVVGVDIDKDNIKWCQDNLTGGVFEPSELYPPLQFGDNSFDFVVATSVFTHLERAAMTQWLAELSRVLKPNGIAALTVNTNCTPAWRSFDNNTIDLIQKEGIYDKIVSPDLGNHLLQKDYYRNVFMTKEFIRENWSLYFNILDIREHVFNYQDVVICQVR